MNDQTDRFLDVTEAAEKLHEALSELARETQGYSEAGGRLDAATATAQALAEATTKVLEEERAKWGELKEILDGRVSPALEKISDHSDKQTAHMASLSGAVAGQQTQLTQIHQSSAEAVRYLAANKPLTDTLLQEARAHNQRLEGTRGELEGQREMIGTAVHFAKHGVYAAWIAVLVTLAVLTVVLLK